MTKLLTGEKKREANKRGKAKLQEKKRKELLAYIDDQIDDVEVIITNPEPGKQRITYEMGVDTLAALEMVAIAQGTTFDAIMRAVITKNLLEAAKLRQVKEWAQRAAARDQQRAERERHAQEAQAARTAEIEELEADLARLRAMIIAAEKEAIRTGQPAKYEKV